MADTFVFDKSKVFVSGLFWQALSGSQADYKKLTKKAAAEINSQGTSSKLDVAAWRTSPALQVGLGASADGVKPGMMSAAAVVSKAMEELKKSEEIKDDRDFLCAVQIPTGWLYVAQREGVILYNGDIISTEDAIKSRLLGDMSLSDWKTIIAPEHWGIRGAVGGKTFADFLPTRKGKIDYKKWWEVKPIDRMASFNANPVKASTPILLVVALGIAVSVGYQKWKNHQLTQEAMRLAMMHSTSPAPAIPPIHPWKSEPLAAESISTCLKAIKGVRSLWPGNWEPQEATCSGGALNLSWKAKEFGWMEHLKAVEPNAMFSPDGSIASLSIPLELPTHYEDEVLLPEAERSYEMQSQAQKHKITLTLAPKEPIAPALPGQQDPQAILKDWKELKWSIAATLLSPISIADTLGGQGFRITRIQAVFSNGLISWNLEGTQYVQP
ncbi:type 4b pilus protein PilO2 [Methylovorus glucosotrophus]|uniref:Pilin accessory protein (PilO) n=1 Tax=Methylovorus glucosotrophus (strain SIP3-4) TaxID=582744 RepID=C6XET0_METGS|nr:type 4b pilus protein PilO2 [Methylovorus glucosotrophus]ACT52137.1 hypothetical protein Msip34_2913 [Methylovorus glucosotrophus SIP3-4]